MFSFVLPSFLLSFFCLMLYIGFSRKVQARKGAIDAQDAKVLFVAVVADFLAKALLLIGPARAMWAWYGYIPVVTFLIAFVQVGLLLCLLKPKQPEMAKQIAEVEQGKQKLLRWTGGLLTVWASGSILSIGLVYVWQLLH